MGGVHGSPRPRTSFNGTGLARSAIRRIRGELEDAKRVAHANGATVNDVVLAAVAGGYRDLLTGHGEPVDGLVLWVFVPVSSTREQPDQARGNVDGGFVPFPVGEPDPPAGFAASPPRRRSGSATRPPRRQASRTIMLQRAFLRLMPTQRFMNAYVANVPGPPIPLFFAGAPILEVFPLTRSRRTS